MVVTVPRIATMGVETVITTTVAAPYKDRRQTQAATTMARPMQTITIAVVLQPIQTAAIATI